MGKTILKWVLLVLLLAYMVGMAIWAHGEAERHACKGISISIRGEGISDKVTQHGVQEILKSYPKKIIGMPVNRINTLEIERYINSSNNFEDVRCYITSKGYLAVAIQPMVPEIRVFDGDKSYYVNKDGKKIASSANFYSEVPVVTGHFSDKLRPEMVLPVVRFIERDSVLRNLVTMYEVKDKDNILLVPRITGHVINFGDTTRLEEKRHALMLAYKEIMPHRGWEAYDTISVKFRGQIVATRRNKAPLFPMEVIEEEVDMEEATLPRDSV